MKKTFKAYLDRIEGDFAVVYLGGKELKVDIPKNFMPKDIKEGINLKITISTDEKSDEKVSNDIEELRKKLLENN